LIRLSSSIFLFFLLIASITSAINTHGPYPLTNSPELLNLFEFSYQYPTLSYSNYTLISNWPLLTSSFKTADIYNMPFSQPYSIPFSQPDFTNYFLQPTTKRPLVVDFSRIFKNDSYSYQLPFGPFHYQPSMMQDRVRANFNIPYTLSYMPAAMEYMPFVFSIGSYTSSFYPGHSYPSNNYPGHSYPWPPVTTDDQQQPRKIIGTIGIIGDVHCTDKNSTDRRFRNLLSGPRFYSEAGDDLADFVNRMNSMNVDAAIELGDFIDIHSGNSLAEGNTNTHNDGTYGEIILFEAESIYSKLIMPYYHVIGNWDMYDYDFATDDDWFKFIINGNPDTIDSLGGTLYTDAIGNPVSRYYSFKFGSVLGIVLDSSGSGVSGDNYLINTNGIIGTGYVPQKQLNWLTGVLADNSAGENMPVIVFIHPFLYPIFTGNKYYMCINHSSVRSILEADKNVIAVFNSHHHPGALNWWDDIYNNPKSSSFHTATGVFGKKYNGIEYYNLRGSIIGWGSDHAGPIQRPSNIYYVLTVKKGASISLEVESFRTN